LDRSVGKKPKYLVVLERAGEVLLNHSSAYRARVKRLHKAGYEGVLKHVDPISCGSPTWGSFFVTIYYQMSLGITDGQALKLIGNSELLPRSFENCLLPVGVPRNLWTPKHWKCQEATSPQRPNHLGHVRQHLVVDPLGPALLDPELRVSLSHGLRCLDPQEWVKIKGLPKSWRPGSKAIWGIVESMGAHKWGALGDFLLNLEASRGNVNTVPLSADKEKAPETGTELPLDPPPTKSEPDWSWEPPDLSLGSVFYKEQRALLESITAEYEGPPEWISNGKLALAAHRNNYGPDGPKKLVILWWNWPPEHWSELRDGASMNFLEDPSPGLVDNSVMTEDQLN
jgi:hypothetical protein